MRTTTAMSDADVIIARRFCEFKCCASSLNSHMPHWNGPQRLHINQNADTCNREDFIRQQLQWLPRRTSVSMTTRKKRFPWRHRRSDRRVVMMTPHRRRRSLPRRNPPGDHALTTVTPPTRKMMTTTMGAMTTTMGAPMTAMISSTTLPSIS
jgi:hypothetical protein